MISRIATYLMVFIILIEATSCGGIRYTSDKTNGIKGQYKYIDINQGVLESYVNQKKIIFLGSYNRKFPENYRYIINKIDQDSVYGSLQIEPLFFHKHRKNSFVLRKSYSIDGEKVPLTKLDQHNPEDILHIYTTQENLKEGNFTLALSEINMLERHKKGKKAWVRPVVVTASTLTGLILLLILPFVLGDSGYMG